MSRSDTGYASASLTPYATQAKLRFRVAGSYAAAWGAHARKRLSLLGVFVKVDGKARDSATRNV
jgi:hypothetical protein